MAINFNKIKEISIALEKGNRGTLRCFHCSYLIKKNRIVAIGWNSIKTNPQNLQYNYTGRDGNKIGHTLGTHSELSVVIKYGEEDCSDCYVVNTRLNMHNQFSSAAPCKGCIHVLNQVGFKGIFATDKNGEFEKII